MTPFVSVLIPSRGRPERLFEAIGTLLFRATQPDAIEFLIGLDEDDPRLAVYSEKKMDGPAWMSQVWYFMLPRGRGYGDLDKHWNNLARHARAPWLWAFNDDTFVVTRDWDDVIRHYDEQYSTTPCVLAPSDNSTDAQYRWCAFPIFTREIVTRLGHATIFPSIDNWLEEIIHRSDHWPFVRVPISVDHQRLLPQPGFSDPTWMESAEARKEMAASWAAERETRWMPLIVKDRVALHAKEN